MPDIGTALSVLSGLLQAAGYFLYFRGSLRHEILPNASTWLMFAWDTTLLVVLHASLGASPMLLLLPTVCASCSIAVAAVSWAKRGFRWPDDEVDRFALTSCGVLTIGYATLVILAAQGLVSSDLHRAANIAMLLFSNGSTIVSFVPMIHTVRRNPATERPAAWLVWACAYALLLASTMLIHGWSEPELVLFPIVNFALHLLIAWLSSPARRPLQTISN